MNTYVIDVDHTICTAPWNDDCKAYDYKKANPHPEMIQAINKAYHEGNIIILFTARGMRTFNGNVELIENYHRPILEEWLLKHSVNYHDLIFGKPWGPNVHYIDDKNLSIEEFIKK